MSLWGPTYFQDHPWYKGLRDGGTENAIAVIRRFVTVHADALVVVIGCGYGRDSVEICPHVRRVYGVDVSRHALALTKPYLAAHNVQNFVPVPTKDFARHITTVDFAFSVAVMQHVTDEVVRNYLIKLRSKVCDGVLFQFLEGNGRKNGPEPSISRSLTDIRALTEGTGMHLTRSETMRIKADALWHWCWFTRGGMDAQGN